MNRLQERLFILDAKYREERNAPQNKNLRVFYGWAKIGKIRNREAISVIFENDRQNEERTQRFIKRMQDTVYTRFQTEDEAMDACGISRMFTEYSIFLSDKKVNGSLEKALSLNMEADKNNVTKKVLLEIFKKLRDSFMENHRGYKEPPKQLCLFDESNNELNLNAK